MVNWWLMMVHHGSLTLNWWWISWVIRFPGLIRWKADENRYSLETWDVFVQVLPSTSGFPSANHPHPYLSNKQRSTLKFPGFLEWYDHLWVACGAGRLGCWLQDLCCIRFPNGMAVQVHDRTGSLMAIRQKVMARQMAAGGRAILTKTIQMVGDS